MKKILSTLILTTMIGSLPLHSNNHLKIKNNNQESTDITCNIDYSSYWHLSASWSGTARKSDEKEYKLINFLSYSNSWEEFINTYPNITIETAGQAVSPETFGDVGQNHFGSINLSTSEFFNSEINYEYLVDASDGKVAAYTVDANIGFGFQTKDDVLSLFPTIYGRITSVGAYTRTLDFGLSCI